MQRLQAKAVLGTHSLLHLTTEQNIIYVKKKRISAKQQSNLFGSFRAERRRIVSILDLVERFVHGGVRDRYVFVRSSSGNLFQCSTGQQRNLNKLRLDKIF